MKNKIFNNWLDDNSLHLYNLYEILTSYKAIRNISKEDFVNFIYETSSNK